MAQQQPAWQRWSGRLAWFGAGAALSAIVVWSGRDGANDHASTAAAQAGVDVESRPLTEAGAAPRSPADGLMPNAVAAPTGAAAAQGAAAEAEDGPSAPTSAQDAVAVEGGGAAEADTAAVPASAAASVADLGAADSPADASPAVAPAGPPPRFPLPRMPGTRRLRATATPADDGRGWVLVQTVRVPAKAAQAETFYRKALADQGLKVHGGATAARPNRVFLRGRSRRVHADVAISGKAGRVETTVRVIWRVFR